MAEKNLKIRVSADTADFNKNMDKAAAATDKFSKSAKSSFSDFAKLFGVNIGDISAKIDQAKFSLNILGKGFQSAATSGSGFAKAMNVIKLALVSTGIGALVVGIGAVITYFTRFSDGAGIVKKAVAGISEAVDVALERVAMFGRGITQVFTGDFAKGIESMKNSITGIGEKLAKEVKEAVRLEGEMSSLAKDSKLFDAEREAGMTRLLQLREKASDIEVSPRERIKAVQEANAIEQRLAEKSLALAERDVAISLEQIDAASGKLEMSKEALDLIERIKSGQISANEAQAEVGQLVESETKLKDKLFEVVDKIISREKEQQNIVSTRLKLQKTENTLRKEIISQETSELKSQAELKDLQAKNEKRSIKERTIFLRDALDLREKALRIELNANNISAGKFLAELDQLKIEFENKISELRSLANPKMDKISPIALQFDYKGKIKTTEIKPPKIGELETDKLRASANKIKGIYADIEESTKQLNMVFNSAIQSLAFGFGESIGKMLAGADGIKSIKNMVIGTFADMAITVGKIAISMGLTFEAIGKLFKNPYLAVAAGVALVALGTWAKTALAGSMTAGGTFSQNSGGFSETPGVSRGNSMRGAPLEVILRGEFKQRGADLVAVINQNTTIRNLRT